MIDLHNDALLVLPPKKLLPYLRTARQNGVTEIWLSVWTTKLKNPLATIRAKRALLDRIAGDVRYPLCRLHIEDAWFLTPRNLPQLLALKPHSVGLTWNGANCLAGGAHSRGGLTPFGCTVIKTLEAAGVQIDVAHLNRRSFWEFTRLTTRPLVCTHTAFNACHRHPRNLTTRQVRAIMASNGRIGLCLVPQFLTHNTRYCGYYDIIKHINWFKRHFQNYKLSWGTDFYGTDNLPQGIHDYRDLFGLWQAQIFGFSVCHQPLLAYQLGNHHAPHRLLITGGMHAREWITVQVVRELLRQNLTPPPDFCLLLVPNCNPDGTLLTTSGIGKFSRRRQKLLYRLNQNHDDFSQWKANARGVDLNVNFAAKWGQGAQNLHRPAPANYIGRRPHSEPETRALLRLIKKFRPTASLAFHSKGEVIYYSRPADAPLAQALAARSGYQPLFSQNSGGGLTDYLALTRHIPALTIEVGRDDLPHPITSAELPAIMAQIKDFLPYFFTGA